MTATAYDGRVRVSWDSAALVAGLDHYDDAVQIVVRRHDAQGQVSQVAELPADSTGFTDTGLTNYEPVTYELSLSGAGASSADAMVHVDAWVQGHGRLAVLAPYAGTRTTARIAPEAELDRLRVSLGLPELSYPGTGMPASALMQRLSESLSQTPGVAVVDRAALRCFVGADRDDVLFARMPRPGRRPRAAAVTHGGFDRPRGRSPGVVGDGPVRRPIATAAQTQADQAVEQTDLFITAMQTCLETRLPEAVADTPQAGPAPSLVVIGPIFPVDQPNLYYPYQALADQLAQAGDQPTRDLR